MGFFDFLKWKMPEAPKEQREEKAPRERSLEEIENALKEEGKKLEASSLKLKGKAKSLIDNVIPSLKENIASLESVKIEERREDERLKKLVKESLNVYVASLKRLVEELENIKQEKEIKDCMAKTMQIFGNFSRNSAKSYQKATILVGKEFEPIKNILRDFSQEFNSIVIENTANSKRVESLAVLSRILESISETEKIKGDIKNNIQRLDAEKVQKEIQIKKNEEELRGFMTSEDYKKGLEETRKAKIELEELENDITYMKERLNLKELARKHHGDRKKNEIVQKYIKDFKLAMSEDKGIMLAKMGEGSGGIDIDIAKINEKKSRIESYLSQSELGIREIKEEAERLRNEINKIESRKEAELKKIEKFDEKKGDLVCKLKSEAHEVLFCD